VCANLPVVYGLGKPLDSLLLKVERAKKYISDLEAEYDRFHQTKPYTFSDSTNPQTGERTYYVEHAEPIPMEFSVIIGDALNNLRCALDHLAYHLVYVGVGAVKSYPDAKFPMGNSLSDYNEQKLRALNGMRQDAVTAIDALEPYIGGAGEYFVHLARLNNFDKHRLLLTAWSCFEGHKAFLSDREMLAKFHGGKPSDYTNSLLAPTSRIFPLKAGDTLLTVPKSEVEDDLTFLLGIAFAEPEIVMGKPVIGTLREMTKLVQHVIFDFDRKGLLQ
jgi:hypothetical protein